MESSVEWKFLAKGKHDMNKLVEIVTCCQYMRFHTDIKKIYNSVENAAVSSIGYSVYSRGYSVYSSKFGKKPWI